MPVLSSTSAIEHCHAYAFLSFSLGSVVLFAAGVYLRRRSQRSTHSQTQSSSSFSVHESRNREYDDEKTNFESATHTSPPPLPSKPPPPYTHSAYGNNFYDQPKFTSESQYHEPSHSYYTGDSDLPLLGKPNSCPSAAFTTDLAYLSEEPEDYSTLETLPIKQKASSYPGAWSWAPKSESAASSQSWFENNPQTYYSTPISTPTSSYTSSIPLEPPFLSSELGHEPHPEATRLGSGSYSSVCSSSSLDSDGLPRRRSYTKTVPRNGESMDVKGEVLITEGGWRRHTRVFGGGRCQACEESEEKARRLGVVLPSVEIS